MSGVRRAEGAAHAKGGRPEPSVALLRDGGSIGIRPLLKQDRDKLSAHFRDANPQSAYFRFFRVKKILDEDEFRRFTEPDFVRNAALVATLGRGEEEQIVGVGRYRVVDGVANPSPYRAEIAISVAHEHQG